MGLSETFLNCGLPFPADTGRHCPRLPQPGWGAVDGPGDQPPLSYLRAMSRADLLPSSLSRAQVPVDDKPATWPSSEIPRPSTRCQRPPSPGGLHLLELAPSLPPRPGCWRGVCRHGSRATTPTPSVPLSRAPPSS